MRRLFLFSVISVLLIFSLVGCGSASTPVPSPTVADVAPTVTVASATAPMMAVTSTPDPDQLRATILAAFKAQDEKAWRYQSDVVLEDGSSHHTTLEFLPPDQYHIISDATAEMVVTNQKVYMLQDGAWVETSIPYASLIDPEASNRLQENISEVQFLREEPVNGETMLVSQFKSKVLISGSESPVEMTVWIGESDGLLYKILMDGNITVTDSNGGVEAVKATSTILYEYDPGIQIPKPEN